MPARVGARGPPLEISAFIRYIGSLSLHAFSAFSRCPLCLIRDLSARSSTSTQFSDPHSATQGLFIFIRSSASTKTYEASYYKKKINALRYNHSLKSRVLTLTALQLQKQLCQGVTVFLNPQSDPLPPTSLVLGPSRSSQVCVHDIPFESKYAWQSFLLHLAPSFCSRTFFRRAGRRTALC